MANKLGSSPSSGGWKPPSGDQHPPFSGGQKGSCIGGAHDAGPTVSAPAENTTTTSSMQNAVIRNQTTNPPPRK